MPIGRVTRTTARRWHAFGKGGLRAYEDSRNARFVHQAAKSLDINALLPGDKDHFIGGVLRNYWNTLGTVALLDAENGIVQLTVNSGTTTSRLNYANIRAFRYGLDPRIEIRLKASDTLQRTIRAGFRSGNTTTDFIYFENDAGASAVNWFGKTDKAGTGTSVDLSVAGASTFIYLLLTCDSLRGVISFYTKTEQTAEYILRGTITTNIPTVRLQPNIEIINNNTGTHVIQVDSVQPFQLDSDDITTASDAIVWRDSKTATGTGVASITITKPTGTIANDCMLAAIVMDQVDDITIPAGWSIVREETFVAAGKMGIYRKVAGTSEAASYVFSFATLSGNMIGGISTYGAADSVTPVDNSAIKEDGATGTAHATDSILSAYAEAMVVTFFGVPDNAPTWTPPTGETERYDISIAASMSLTSADEIQSASGLTGAKSATSSSSVIAAEAIVTLRPA